MYRAMCMYLAYEDEFYNVKIIFNYSELCANFRAVAKVTS